MDDLSEWFTDADTNLAATSPCSSDPDGLRRKLQEQKVSSLYL